MSGDNCFTFVGMRCLKCLTADDLAYLADDDPSITVCPNCGEMV